MDFKTGDVIVDFFATWCGPCAAIAKSLEEIEAEGAVKVVRIDVDEHSGLAKDYGIMSIPTLIRFKDGVEVKRIVGSRSKSAIVADLGIEDLEI